jgi:hypothetical protein
MKSIKTKIIEKREKLEKEVKNYLMDNLDKFEYVEEKSVNMVFKFDGEVIEIFTWLGRKYVRFSGDFCGVKLKTESDSERTKLINLIKKTNNGR